MEGEGKGFVFREDGEVAGLQHVTEVSHGLVNCQELPVVSAVFLLSSAEFPGKEGERMLGVLYSFLEDGTHGSG
jgi:hypothetical protein